MNIFGRTHRIEWGYKPQTKLGIKWTSTEGGGFSALDRGTDNDKYFAEISIRDLKADIELLEQTLSGRIGNTSQLIDLPITLEEGEEIFGAEIQTGLVNTYLVEKTLIQHVNIKESRIRLKLLLRPDSITKVSLAGGPDLNHLVYPQQYTGDREYIFNKHIPMEFSSGSDYSVSNEGFTKGSFKANFVLTTEEMQYTRRYLIENLRGNSIVNPDPGGKFDSLPIVKLFGEWKIEPHTIKIIDWNDKGRLNRLYWGIEITMARIG